MEQVNRKLSQTSCITIDGFSRSPHLYTILDDNIPTNLSVQMSQLSFAADDILITDSRYLSKNIHRVCMLF